MVSNRNSVARNYAKIGFPAKRKNRIAEILHFSRPFRFIFAFRSLTKEAKILFFFSRNFSLICFAQKLNVERMYCGRTDRNLRYSASEIKSKIY